MNMSISTMWIFGVCLMLGGAACGGNDSNGSSTDALAACRAHESAWKACKLAFLEATRQPGGFTETCEAVVDQTVEQYQCSQAAFEGANCTTMEGIVNAERQKNECFGN